MEMPIPVTFENNNMYNAELAMHKSSVRGYQIGTFVESTTVKIIKIAHYLIELNLISLGDDKTMAFC